MIFLNLCFMLLVILVSAEIFTNALEHLGEKLKISEGVTGSIFAAIGTALPETLVPLLALMSNHENQTINEEVGVGAILGAPLMLSTLTLFLMAFSVLKHRGLQGHLKPEKTGLIRDLDFFIISFLFAGAALFIPHSSALARDLIGFIMIFSYFIYLLLTIRASKKLVEVGHATEASSPMLLEKVGLSNNYMIISIQLLLGLMLLIYGAKGFIVGVEEVSSLIGISTLILSMLIIPIATELPEKINSILWIRKGKDTLAFGNVTGAMVFQGTLLPAIGIILTPWAPRKEIYLSILITLIAAIWIRFLIQRSNIKVWHLGINGALYLTYLFFTLY